jgi:hypothetical protein
MYAAGADLLESEWEELGQSTFWADFCPTCDYNT